MILEFTADEGKQIRYTTNACDGSVIVEHVDVGRNPAPPILLYIIPAASVPDLKNFFDSI